MSIFEFLKHRKKEKKETEKTAPEGPERQKKAEVISSEDSASQKQALHKSSQHTPWILVRPHITEKSSGMKILNKYVVEVKPEANKIEIKKAIQKLFKVTPINIHSITVPGKTRRFGKVSGKTKDRKKVIITLRGGEKIDVGEGK